MAPAQPDRWDVLASRYDLLTSGLERRFLARHRPWVAERVRGRTLEVGIGTGANLPHYPPGLELVGVERSPAMLEQARARASEHGLQVELVLGDAAALDLPDASFDSVVATFVLCSVADVRAVLVELTRVLRPGGSLLLADHVGSDRRWLWAAQTALDAVTVPVKGEHFRRRPLETVRALGLEVVETERMSLGAMERVHARTPR